jgi:hypothetical protein
MTISKEYLLQQLESAMQARRDALNLFHLRDGVVQTIELLLNKIDAPEPELKPELVTEPQDAGTGEKPSKFSGLFNPSH